jgi:hypothetical protein
MLFLAKPFLHLYRPLTSATKESVSAPAARNAWRMNCSVWLVDGKSLKGGDGYFVYFRDVCGRFMSYNFVLFHILCVSGPSWPRLFSGRGFLRSAAKALLC